MGENPSQQAPTLLYGIVLFAAAIAYHILQRTIISAQGKDSTLKLALGRDWKGIASPLLYASGTTLAFIKPWMAQVVYVLVALLWLIPDVRVVRGLDLEKQIQK